jgi:alpha-tubulin suppressor-like RCC1 family protein
MRVSAPLSIVLFLTAACGGMTTDTESSQPGRSPQSPQPPPPTTQPEGETGSSTPSSPPDPDLEAIPTSGPVRAIRAFGNQTCAVTMEGAVRCWGEGHDGNPRLTPVVIEGLQGVATVAPGQRHACVALTDGTVRCWGSNDEHQLGDETTPSQNVPSLVPGLSDVTRLSASGSFTAARRTDGTVVLWGSSPEFMGGRYVWAGPTVVPHLAQTTNTLAAESDSGFPVTCSVVAGSIVRCVDPSTQISRDWLIPGAAKVIALASYRVCAVTSDHETYCWAPRVDQSGSSDPPVTDDKPVRVRGMSGATHVAASGGHACAVLAGGVSCSLASIGGPAWYPGSKLAPVAGLRDVVAVAVGDAHVCALGVTGTISCWGNNDHGQLGDGTTTSRTVPAPVVW